VICELVDLEIHSDGGRILDGPVAFQRHGAVEEAGTFRC